MSDYHYYPSSRPYDNGNENDDPSHMTYSRRAARYLSQFQWYYPQKTINVEPIEGNHHGHRHPQPPSLDKAWHHYEHVTLARCPQNEESTANTANATKTKLYPVLSSNLQELTQHSRGGVSSRMYFSTLLVWAGIMALAGLLNVPLMIYFWGYAKEGNKDGVSYMGMDSTIRSSALCDATEWVYCPSCFQEENVEYFPSYRLDASSSKVRRNVCNFDDFGTVGLCSYVATVVVILLVIVVSWKQRKAEIVFDEAIQTASDYSIKINNPPPNALSTEEWRHFFNRFGDKGGGVVMVTIALNNAKLLRALVTRRQKLQQLSYIVPPGTDMTDAMQVWNWIMTHTVIEANNTVATNNNSFGSFVSSLFNTKSKAPRLWQEIQHLEAEIRDLAQEKYEAVTVFVTFETERSQRNALHALSTGKMNVWNNTLDVNQVLRAEGVLRVYESFRNSSLWDCYLDNDGPQREHTIRLASPSSSSSTTSTQQSSKRDSISKTLLFRGYHVLYVKEAMEPSDVRWVDLQASTRQRLELYLASTVGMLVFVMWSGYFIYCLVDRYPGYYATIFITMMNTVVPMVCKFIGDLESHPTEHGQQISLYVKITIFRCFNSAIALSVVSSFIESISVEDENEQKQESLIYKVYPVIVAELFCTPLVDLMDLEGNFRKHILAPRARDQEEMNACFRGSPFWLAEKYTNANKVLFVTLFFSSILPEALFLGAMALMAQYYVAKFALLRLCGPSPDLGFHLSRLSHIYFVPFALTAHVAMSAYWWSGYPYDNVCPYDGGGYVFCDQNLYGAGVFPPLPRFQPEGLRWMTDSQETLTGLYGWTSLIVLMSGFVFFVRHTVIPRIRAVYENTYVPDGMDQGIGFMNAKNREELQGYIPQASVPGFVFPLLACDINGIDEDLIGWKDTARGYAPHSLADDVQRITGSKSLHPIFSMVQQWNPQES